MVFGSAVISGARAAPAPRVKSAGGQSHILGGRRTDQETGNSVIRKSARVSVDGNDHIVYDPSNGIVSSDETALVAPFILRRLPPSRARGGANVGSTPAWPMPAKMTIARTILSTWILKSVILSTCCWR
jgi:hypothetical protein